MSCQHLDEAPTDTEPLSTEGCMPCLAAGERDWVHLRLCLECGLVACCDSSPRRHATAHFGEERHPVMRSLEPGETWRWCFLDEQLA